MGAFGIVSLVDVATEDESGNGMVMKALGAVLFLVLLFSSPIISVRAHAAASQASLCGLPAWATREFLIEALEIQEKYGLYASVTIAQAHLEVGGTFDGESLYKTASAEHNYFGLKSAGGECAFEGEVTWDGTSGASGIYRKYASIHQGLMDRARLLLTSPYYADVESTAYGCGTSREQAIALSESPWCENGYANLTQIMEAYGLFSLDAMTASDVSLTIDGSAAVSRARSMIGRATYVWGACDAKNARFDCSGFVSWCLTGKSARLGTTDTFINWKAAFFPQPGDVCVYTGAQYPGGGHCGIFIGVIDGTPMMIDCSDGVDVRPVDEKMVYRRYG